MFLVSLWLIPDEPLLSSQPLLSGHLPFPRGWPLNRDSTVIIILMIITIITAGFKVGEMKVENWQGKLLRERWDDEELNLE